MKINALVVEDEVAAAKRLVKMIRETDPDIYVAGITDSVQSTLRWLSENSDPDLIFLDIHLADGSGFKIIEQADIKSPVIFTTAYDQYAVQAFKVNSVDYLLKPIKREELSFSINKYKRNKPALPDLEMLLEEIRRQQSRSWQKRFVVQYADKIKAINADDIAYFTAREKSVFLVASTGTMYAVDFSLDKLETVLDPDIFFRVNRKFIASLDSIRTMHLYSKSRFKIDLLPVPDQDVIVSSEKSAQFKEWLNR